MPDLKIIQDIIRVEIENAFRKYIVVDGKPLIDLMKLISERQDSQALEIKGIRKDLKDHKDEHKKNTLELALKAAGTIGLIILAVITFLNKIL